MGDQVTASRLLEVPYVIGKQFSEASVLLRPFRVRQRIVEGVQPEGEVVDQDPRPPGQRLAGEAVRVDVSDGSLVVVPPVGRLDIAEAQRRLQGEGQLVVEVMERAVDEAPGTVVDQAPEAGKVVRRGSVVQLVVSAGMVMPSVINMSIGEARERLVKFRLRETAVERTEPRGQVIGQHPPAGTHLAAGSPVTVHVSDGSLVAVPALQALTLAAARDALESAGALVAEVDKDFNRPDGTVESQMPTAGAIVKRGSAVRLSVVLPKPPVGWYIAGVAALLAAAGLGWRALRKTARTGHNGGQAAPAPELVARLERHPEEVGIVGALPTLPALKLRAHLERGKSTMDLGEGDSS